MSSIIPNFEYDIFISYRNNDNLDGWVTDFVQSLEKELRSTLKDTATIYFDKNPHDGLLETHNVDKSLEGKLKCLIFIPIISQTYCDTKSFAWQHEFCVFNKLAKDDQFGRDIKLNNGNVASRILPIQIHDLDTEDKTIIENEIGGALRAVEFIYKSVGVNRPMTSEDDQIREPGKVLYRDQVNKAANAIKEIIASIKSPTKSTTFEIFAISNPGIKIPDTTNLEGKGEKAQQESICILVLPFVNMSNDAEQEYFNDGLTEELIISLSRLKEMKVISRTTSMKYKGTNKDIITIWQETGADYVMEGSVRKQGNNLRITAQFLDAKRDIHIWAENYRGTLDDIFDIQENVAAKIVEALRLHLTIDEKYKLRKRYTENTEAYQLYLQGRYFWNKRNEEGFKSAIRHFEKALEKDPDYALAWAGLADTYSLMGEYTKISRREIFPMQIAAVNKALEIDNRLGEAHISLATSVMLNEWDWKNSEKEFKLGIELSPNYATGHHWYAEWLLYNGNFEKSLKEISIAVELDPVSPAILKDKGIYFYYTRQYDKAIDIAMITLELDPNFVPAHRLLSLAYMGKEMFEEAIIENQRWGNGTGNKVKTDVALAQIYAVAGRKEDAEKIMNISNSERILSGNDYRGIALVYAALGNNDKAFEWLEKSCERHEESLCSLQVDPKADKLRSDPRFNKILKQINFLE